MITSPLVCFNENTLAAFASGELDADRRRVVDEHISKCSNCRSLAAAVIPALIDSSAAAPSSMCVTEVTAIDDAGAPTPLPVPGHIIDGKYRIERLIGVGGMGSVYSATHLSLEQCVAIKFLRPVASNARFLREGRVLARLYSPNIVRVYDAGQFAERTPYIVMEYLKGSDLSGLIARGPLAISDALDYVRQACMALAVAHAANVVHRDLKPSNLFLTQDNGTTVVKVLDFGISKDLATQRQSLSLTASGALIGSPRYMSPEQLTASSEIMETADIWALGVVLYEMLTGRPPFAEASLTALMLAIVNKRPASPREMRSSIPDRLDVVVMRCLEKDPSNRYANVGELMRALGKVKVRTLPRWTRLSRRTMVVVAAAALCCVLGLSASSVSHGDAPSSSDSPQPNMTPPPTPDLGLHERKTPAAQQKQNNDLPDGWLRAGDHRDDYDMGVDYNVFHSGRMSGYIRSETNVIGFGTLMQEIAPGFARGKRLAISAFIKTKDVNSWAGLWLRIDGPMPRNVLGFDNMGDRPIRRTTDWTQYEVVLDVPAETTLIACGVLLAGNGTVWIDDLRYEIVDESVETTGIDRRRSLRDRPVSFE